MNAYNTIVMFVLALSLAACSDSSANTGPGAPLPENTAEFKVRADALNAAIQANAVQQGGMALSIVPIPQMRNMSYIGQSSNSHYDYLCSIDPSNYGAPITCGQTDIQGRLRAMATDRDLAEVVYFLNNRYIINGQHLLRCTAYICLNRAGYVVGAVQPAMARWMQNNCTIFTSGEYRCDMP